jgi:hypothetical protein
MERAPTGLKKGGKQLWKDSLAGWDIPSEQHQLLENACRSQDRIDELQKLIERDGPVIKGRFGLVAHPASQLLRSEVSNFSQLYRLLQLEAPGNTEGDDGRT